MGDRREVELLYDIWEKGAPTLDSAITDVKHYNPEKATKEYGYVKRIIPSGWLKAWLRDISAKRGIPLSDVELDSILEGERL